MLNIDFDVAAESRVTDFTSWLRREYLRRRAKNSRYSIRSFAKYLNMAAPTVSHMLSGKRVPSEKIILRLFEQLEVSVLEKKAILSRFRKHEDITTTARDENYALIAMDSFKIIADWYHVAILELTYVKDFQYNHSWIANRLGISVPEVRVAIERMIRLELLEEKNGKLIKTSAFLTNGEEGLTNAAMKQLQRHVLEKALSAIDETPASEKDITSITMAIDVRKIPEAKKLIKKFRRDMCSFLEEGSRTRVYNLGIQLYPVSKNEK